MGSVPLSLMREAIVRNLKELFSITLRPVAIVILVASLTDDIVEQFEDDPDGKHNKLQPGGRYEIQTFQHARDQC